MKDNLFSLIKYLWEYKQMTVKDSSVSLNLDKSTISRYLKKLKDVGIVQTIGSLNQGPQGGRKTLIHSFNYDIFHILGLEIEQNGINGVVVNLKGQPINKFVIKEKINKSNLVNLIQNIVQKKNDEKFVACGVSLPGIINSKKGVILFSKALGLKEFNLSEELSNTVDIPFLIDNDSNVGAAYYNMKLKKSSKNILYIYVSIPYDIHDYVGVGIGIVINNRLYHGSNNCSGEYEFKLKLVENNDGYISDYYDFLNNHSEKEIFKEIRSFLDNLTSKIGLLASVFDPDTIVFDGGIKFLPNNAINYLIEKTKENIFIENQRKINFVTENAEESINAVGSAVNFITRIFEEKLYLEKIFNKNLMIAKKGGNNFE